MTTLKSMTAYVLEQYELMKNGSVSELIEYSDKTSNYAKFLWMPLELKMFVPVDEYGSVMKEPTVDAYMQPKEMDKQFEAFEKAKSEVIFEGFEICDRLESVKCIANGYLHISYEHAINIGQTIEDLVKYNLPINPNAVSKYKF